MIVSAGRFNLIRPGRAESGRFKLEEKRKLELGLGVPGVLWRDDSTNETLGCDELGLTIEVVSPCDLNGQVTETSFRMSEEMRQVDAATGSAIYDVQVLKTDVMSCFVHVVFNPDFPKITVNLVQKSAADPRMKVGLRQAVIEDDKKFHREKMKSWKQLDQKCKSICDITECTVHEDTWKLAIERSIRRSLGDRFVNQYFAKQTTPLSVLLGEIASKVVGEFERTPTSRQLYGVPVPLSNEERQRLALSNCLGWWEADFKGPMTELFEAAWREYEQSVDALRERLRPLVRDGVTVRVNKVSSTAVCSASGTKYEIVLVDEDTELSLDSDQEKQNSATLD